MPQNGPLGADAGGVTVKKHGLEGGKFSGRKRSTTFVGREFEDSISGVSFLVGSIGKGL